MTRHSGADLKMAWRSSKNINEKSWNSSTTMCRSVLRSPSTLPAAAEGRRAAAHLVDGAPHESGEVLLRVGGEAGSVGVEKFGAEVDESVEVGVLEAVWWLHVLTEILTCPTALSCAADDRGRGVGEPVQGALLDSVPQLLIAEPAQWRARARRSASSLSSKPGFAMSLGKYSRNDLVPPGPELSLVLAHARRSRGPRAARSTR